MYRRISLVPLLFSSLVQFCKTSNDPQTVNELIDPFIHERLSKLGNAISVGNITFAGIKLEDATLTGLQNLERTGAFTVWDWDVDSWSEVYGDLKADWLIMKSPKITLGPDRQEHSGWIKITNPTLHLHYEANFTDYPSCRLEKQLISWSWIDDLIVTTEGEMYISEDEIRRLKLALIPETVQYYFRKLFMDQCSHHYHQYPSSFYFPIRDEQI